MPDDTQRPTRVQPGLDAGHSVDEAAESLFETLGSDPEFEEPQDADESAVDDRDEDAQDPDDAVDVDVEDFEDYEDEDVDDLEDEDEDLEDVDQELLTVTVDGEEVEVTLEEALQGYSRTQDYTRKTQEVAQEREEVREAREQYGELISQLRQTVEAMQPDEPDWDTLKQEDPQKFAAEWAAHQQKQQDLNALQAEEARVAQQEYQEHLQGEQQKMLDAVPEWKEDEAVAAKELGQMMEMAQQAYGFTEEELGAVTDHRAVLILRDAMRYRSLDDKTGKVTSKKKSAQRLKPGSRKSSSGRKSRRKKKDLKRAQERLGKTGRVEDAAGVIANMGLDLD